MSTTSAPGNGWNGVERRNPSRRDRGNWNGIERRRQGGAISEQQLLTQLEEEIQRNRLVLPSLPEVALRVRQILAQPDCSLAELAKAISCDAGLAARLIKVTNSAAYRGSKPIEDIRSAIARLGLQLVRSLVTQLALLQSMHSYGAEAGRQLKALAAHSMDVGARSHALARRFTRLNPEEALLAGLVHDIGKLPLLARLRTLAGTRGDATAENLLWHLHTRVGGMVLRSWQFGPEFVAVAEEHERFERKPFEQADYADVVIAANLLHHLAHAPTPQRLIQAEQAHVFRKFGMGAQQLLADEELQAQIALNLQRLRL